MKYFTKFSYIICCEICNDIIATYFECPVCKKWVTVDFVGSAMGRFEEEGEFIFKCDKCLNSFKFKGPCENGYIIEKIGD